MLMRRLPPTVRARIAAAALVPALVPAAALFHLRLLRSAPATDAVLTRPPAAVHLWFSQRAELAVTRVRLVGPAGEVALGPLQREATGAGSERTVVAPVRGPMRPGAYSVEWRTMAADGHSVSGQTSFRITAPAPAR